MSELKVALEESKNIFSKKLREIRQKENDAKDNLAFIESRYWSGVYHQMFELRYEIERMLNKKQLNEYCVLSAFMPKDKRNALAKAQSSSTSVAPRR